MLEQSKQEQAELEARLNGDKIRLERELNNTHKDRENSLQKLQHLEKQQADILAKHKEQAQAAVRQIFNFGK